MGQTDRDAAASLSRLQRHQAGAPGAEKKPGSQTHHSLEALEVLGGSSSAPPPRGQVSATTHTTFTHIKLQELTAPDECSPQMKKLRKKQIPNTTAGYKVAVCSTRAAQQLSGPTQRARTTPEPLQNHSRHPPPLTQKAPFLHRWPFSVRYNLPAK